MTNIKNFSKQTIIALIMLTFLFTSFSTTLTAYAASSKKIANCKFSISSTVAYTGKTLTPTVTVKNGKTTLKKGKHYTVTYSSNKNFGTAKAVIKAKKGSGYTGSKTLTFKIVPAKVTGLKKGTVKTNSIQLKWAKVKGATGYRVYVYNTSAKKYVTAKTVTTNRATMTSLKASTNYTYRVKAYAKVKNTTVWSAYSDKIVVKTLTAHTHKYTSTVTKKATCTTAGVMTYNCSCGNSYTKSIAKTGHNWKTTTVHHDAETASFDIHETTESWYAYYHLTEWGYHNGYGNNPDYPKAYLAKYAVVKFTAYQCLEGNRSRWEKSDYEYLYYDYDGVIHKVGEDNRACYKKNGHAFVGPSGAGANGFAGDTYSIINWTDLRLTDKDTIIGKHTCVLKEAYDETVSTCTKCGAHK